LPLYRQSGPVERILSRNESVAASFDVNVKRNAMLSVKISISSLLPTTSGKVLIFMLLLSALSSIVNAQGIQPDQKVTDTIQKSLIQQLKKLQVSGTIRMRYINSFQNDIDVNGLEHTVKSNGTSFSKDAFTIPQARIVVAGNITDKMDVYFRANFGDFATSPQGKVLEFAYATYHFNPYLNIRAGLFKPEFGYEDDISTDFLQSFDYTNQYTAFGGNGWMDYQIGVSMMGKAKALGLPVSYAVGIFNGNGRDGLADNDNGKQIPARIQVDLPSGFKIGLSGGLGKDRGVDISAWGTDMYYEKDLNRRLKLSVITEYKEGANQSLFFSQSVPGRSIDNYKLKGAYILPHIQYNTNGKGVNGLEASFKYEYLDPSYKLDGNVYQQYVPMVGIDFAAEYAIRLQFGMVIDNYKNNIENTVEYNSSRFITQLQLRF
jgi:hypothetical protein